MNTMEQEIQQLFKVLTEHQEFIVACTHDIQNNTHNKFSQHKANEIKFRAEDSQKLLLALTEALKLI